MSRTKKNTPAYRTRKRLEMEAAQRLQKETEAAEGSTEVRTAPAEEAEEAEAPKIEDGEQRHQVARRTGTSQKSGKVSNCMGCGAEGHRTKHCPLQTDPEAQQKALDAVKAAVALRRAEKKDAKNKRKRQAEEPAAAPEAQAEVEQVEQAEEHPRKKAALAGDRLTIRGKHTEEDQDVHADGTHLVSSVGEKIDGTEIDQVKTAE